MKLESVVEIIRGNNVLIKNKERLLKHGSKALIVTGRGSSKKNGSLNDVIEALKSNNQEYVVFDEIMANPTVSICFKAKEIAQKNKCDFVVGVGGGSSLDASKVIAFLALNNINEKDIFNVQTNEKVLPIILVPTTCGTGSETTQYAILTDDYNETKTNVSGKNFFAKECYLDFRYLKTLPKEVLINTTLDAISHIIEGIFSPRCSSDILSFAISSLGLIKDVFKKLSSNLSDEQLDTLLYHSTLAGIVISKTGTSLVHLLGYSLTYYKNIDHGKANGLLLCSYLKQMDKLYHSKVNAILDALGLNSIDELKCIIDTYLVKDEITLDEVEKYALKAMNSKKYQSLLYKPEIDEIKQILTDSLILKKARQ